MMAKPATSAQAPHQSGTSLSPTPRHHVDDSIFCHTSSDIQREKEGKRIGVVVPDVVSGQAALSLVLLISGIVILSGLSLLFLVNTFTIATLGFRAANRALAAATAGANDAVRRLVGDMTFPFDIPGVQCSGNPAVAVYEYPVLIGQDTATVTVENEYPCALNHVPQVTVTAEARVANYRRKIRAVASIDTASGRITVVSWQQVTFQ